MMDFLYIVVCLFVAGFFAGLETGLLASNRMILQEKKARGILYARTAEYLLSKPQRLLGTTLIGHNFANVTAAVILTNYFDRLGLRHLALVGIVLMTLVFVVFDDLIPKSFYRRHADGITVRMTPLLLLFYWGFLPLYIILNAIVHVLMVITGQHRSGRTELTSRRDLRFLVHLAGQEVGLEGDDQKMIQDILDFREQGAREVMIPFHRLPVINVGQSLDHVARLAVETGARFLPVSRYRADNVVGYIDSSELLWSDQVPLADLVHEAVYYPETCVIPDLLVDMNSRGLEVVFLSDEFGGIAGLITPSQIIGEIVHYDPETGASEGTVQRLGPGRYLVHGTTDLEDVSHEIGVLFHSGYNKTVGGYVCERLGRIPSIGATYSEAGFVFRVTDRDVRHVKEVEITRAKSS